MKKRLLTAIQKLQIVLEIFKPKDTGHAPNFGLKTIQEKCNGRIKAEEIPRILERLESDGYIIERNQQISIDYKKFEITFEGEVFLDLGGYESKKKKEATSTHLQKIQTWVISFGALAAGIYYLYELCKEILYNK